MISQPEVFKSPGSDTYVVFGEAKIEDLSAPNEQLKNAAAAAAAAENAAEAAAPAEAAPAAATTTATEAAPAATAAADVDNKDVELVMGQANVSREKAIEALKNNKNDVVNAIMALTM